MTCPNCGQRLLDGTSHSWWMNSKRCAISADHCVACNKYNTPFEKPVEIVDGVAALCASHRPASIAVSAGAGL